MHNVKFNPIKQKILFCDNSEVLSQESSDTLKQSSYPKYSVIGTQKIQKKEENKNNTKKDNKKNIRHYIRPNSILKQKYCQPMGLFAINVILNKHHSHIYSNYKENIILSKNKEYFQKYYTYNKSISIIPKRYMYFFHHMKYLEIPKFNDFSLNNYFRTIGCEKIKIYKSQTYPKKPKVIKDLKKDNIVFNQQIIETLENENFSTQESHIENLEISKITNKVSNNYIFQQDNFDFKNNNNLKDEKSLNLSESEIINKNNFEDDSILLVCKNLSKSVEKKRKKIVHYRVQSDINKFKKKDTTLPKNINISNKRKSSQIYKKININAKKTIQTSKKISNLPLIKEIKTIEPKHKSVFSNIINENLIEENKKLLQSLQPKLNLKNIIEKSTKEKIKRNKLIKHNKIMSDIPKIIQENKFYTIFNESVGKSKIQNIKTNESLNLINLKKNIKKEILYTKLDNQKRNTINIIKNTNKREAKMNYRRYITCKIDINRKNCTEISESTKNSKKSNNLIRSLNSNTIQRFLINKKDSNLYNKRKFNKILSITTKDKKSK